MVGMSSLLLHTLLPNRSPALNLMESPSSYSLSLPLSVLLLTHPTCRHWPTESTPLFYLLHFRLRLSTGAVGARDSLPRE